MRKIGLREVLLAGAAATALVFTGVIDASHSSAQAAQQNQGQQKGQGQGGQGQQKGQGGTSMKGGKGGKRSFEDIVRGVAGDEGEEEDSDRPAWAGKDGTGVNPNKKQNTDSGTKKGDLFGDMYVLLRDENGVPILTPEGFVQPLDAEGNPVPLDAEGAPIDPTLAVEVELGRLNVGRAPTSVLIRRADEVVTLLNSATAVSTDAAGRLVLTVDGEEKTIDSPLENLAIYVALMTQGTIPGVTNTNLGSYSFLADGQLTMEDVSAASAFLAGGTDKADPITLDMVAYMNQILDIGGTIEGADGKEYFDFSTFTYDRSDAFASKTADVLVQTSPGVWETQTVNVYDTVFGSQDYSSTGGIETFTQATEDARAVINYIHEYAVPADSVN